MSLNFKIIGKRIKGLRRRKGLTQEKLAEMCNLSVPYISLIESGNREAGLEVLIALANNLEVTIDTFLKGYQKYDKITYQADFALLIADCNNYEKQTIYDVAVAMKKILRNNNCLYYM